MTITIHYPLKSGTARNWPGLIIIDPTVAYRAAVWAQEYYEAQAKLNPATLIKTRIDKKARQELEIMGHEVEVQAAWVIYGVPRDDYRVQEAKRMAAGYNGLFDGMSPSKIAARMREVSSQAERFVRRNRRKIEAQA